MASRVLIMGVAGMLGHTLMSQLVGSESLEVYGSARDVDLLRGHLPEVLLKRVTSDIDALDMAAIGGLLDQLRPNVVVNCIGIIKQDPALADAIRTINVNALFPHLLAKECADRGARLIHVSTDCVFSGRHGNHSEMDIPDPADFYGRSKLLGEVTSRPALTLRTSIIGHELFTKRSLVDWFLSQSGVVSGFTEAIYSGVTATEFARLLARVVFSRSDLFGLFHVASSPISKYELLRLIAAEYDWVGDILPFSDFVCDRSLSGEALFSATGYRPPSWSDMVSDMRSSRLPGVEVST